MGTSHGRASLGVLLLQDLAVVPLLVLLPLLASGDGGLKLFKALAGSMGKALFAIASVELAGKRVLNALFQRATKSRSQEAFLAVVLLSVLGISAFTEAVGLSATLGAFLAGVSLAETTYSRPRGTRRDTRLPRTTRGAAAAALWRRRRVSRPSRGAAVAGRPASFRLESSAARRRDGPPRSTRGAAAAPPQPRLRQAPPPARSRRDVARPHPGAAAAVVSDVWTRAPFSGRRGAASRRKRARFRLRGGASCRRISPWPPCRAACRPRSAS